MLEKIPFTRFLSEMLSALPDDYDKTEGGLFFDLLAPVAWEFEYLSELLVNVENAAFVGTATGDDLDNLVTDMGLTRKEKAKSTGFVEITGKPNTIVDAGLIVMSDTLMFKTTQTGTLSATGQIILPIESVDGGNEYNVGIGVINKFAISQSNLTNVTNTTATTGGYDKESDESLRDRFYIKVREPASSGNMAHYIQWALEVSGVGAAKVIPLWNGAGTVKVVIMDSDGNIPPQSLLTKVHDYLETVRPIGATVTVSAATVKEVTILAGVKLDGSVPLSSVQSQFQGLLVNYILGTAFKEDYLSYAKVGQLLMSIKGVLDYNQLTLNGVTGNLTLATGEIPQLKTVTLTEV